MARTIPAALQAKLDTGLEINLNIVLEIFWTRSTQSAFYADKPIASKQVKARILSLPEFDESVQVSGGGKSTQFVVDLDDIDGEIKAIFDANDIHKAPAKAWVYEASTDFDTDKAEVFLGQINSPVEWSEGGRLFTFTVVNRIEDVEVGFSAEEGAFPQLPEDLIGKTWPLCFGTTINVPALRAVPAVSGLLAGGVGISDFTLPGRIELAEAITCPQTPIGFKCYTESASSISYKAICNIAYETDQNCLQARCVELAKLNLQLTEQKQYEFTEIVIFGGEHFPQGRTITLNINGGLFTGFFDGTPSNPSQTFKIQSRQHPDYDPATGTVRVDEVLAEIESNCPSREDAQDSDFQSTAFGDVFTGLRQSRISWEAYREAASVPFFWAGGGATVTMQNRQEIIYIANIVPTTILRVSAFRTLNGNRFLLTVPSEFYTIRTVDYGGYNVTEIVFERPLSSESQKTGGGWGDDIFISQRSSVGPNTVDIIRWMIETYTDYDIDDTSFNAVRAKIDNYPMHFPLLTRPNLLDILQDLAQKARCALWQTSDTFYIKYLAETPTPVATITDDDILADDATKRSTLRLQLTSTEDIVTKLTSTWRKDHRTDWDDNTLILRHNVQKYGTHDRKEDYFPYAHLDLVRKSSTFWLIRWCNTWKRVLCSVDLKYLKLEPFDAVTLDLENVASAPFTAIVERATLDTSRKQINLELWCPIRAGESTPYVFAFPAGIAEHSTFPSQEAKNRGEAGSGNEPNFSTIAPPGHPLETNTTGVYSGINLGCNGASVISLKPGECRQDHGDGEPSDIGDTKPTVDVPSGTTEEVSGSTDPASNGAGTGALSNWAFNNDWNKKAEGDAGRAREGVAINDSNNDGDGHGNADQTKEEDVDRDFLDELPDPDDLTICHWRCTVLGFGLHEEGTRPICRSDGPAREEVYAFDTEQAALDFCSNLKDSSNCGSEVPCTQCIASCKVTGPYNSGVTGSGACENGTGNLVGFKGAAGYPGISFASGS